MSAAISPAAERRYGVTRVCRAWDVPRSTFYAQAPREATGVNGSANPLHSGGSRVAAPSDNMLPGARRSPRLKRGPQAFTCPGVRPPRRRG